MSWNPFSNNINNIQNSPQQQGGLYPQVQPYYVPSIHRLSLNIDEKEKNIQRRLEVQEKQKKEIEQQYQLAKKDEEFINSLHPTTKEILRLVSEIEASNDFKEVSKLDRLVRDKLFNAQFEEFIK
jgi:Fe2+ transport system protein B